MKSSIVVVGSLNADFVVRVAQFPVPGQTVVGQTFQVFPGGKGANQAYAAARLGARVRMVGQVGNDAQAGRLRDNLAAVGVDVTHVYTDSAVASGVATITTDRAGQNQIIIVPGANGTFRPARLAESRNAIRSAGVLLLQLEVPLPTVLRAARLGRQGGALVILDPAPAQDLPDELVGLADYLTPNESELAGLAGVGPQMLTPSRAAALAGKLFERGARKVLVKMGSQGALLVRPHGTHFWPAIPVKAVDTTAAGDAFNGAFAAALAGGSSELEAGRYATAAAAWSVTRPGAQPSMPSVKQVQVLLRKAAARQ